MSSQHTVHTIAGGWLGTYYYGNTVQTPERFEATFSTPGREGNFGGRILDDGVLGEANVIEGVQSGREIAFIKIYVRPPAGHETAPVYYEGTMSEDGKLLTGTWMLHFSSRRNRTSTLRGTWEARRLWTEVAEEIRDEEPEALRRELSTIGGR
jgi:hypothetical protein